jgi:hypothetical protein
MSGARFHEKLSDTLHQEGFVPSLGVDPDLWIRDADDCFEYVCVDVDDLMAVMKNPAVFFRQLSNPALHNYKLKGVGVPEYHLGGNSGRDPDGTLWWGSQSYIKKMLRNYECQFLEAFQPRKVRLWQMVTILLSWTRVTYWTTKRSICICLWLEQCSGQSLAPCRIDIAYSTMVMSRFRIEPCIGHSLERL